MKKISKQKVNKRNNKKYTQTNEPVSATLSRSISYSYYSKSSSRPYR